MRRIIMFQFLFFILSFMLGSFLMGDQIGFAATSEISLPNPSNPASDQYLVDDAIALANNANNALEQLKILRKYGEIEELKENTILIKLYPLNLPPAELDELIKSLPTLSPGPTMSIQLNGLSVTTFVNALAEVLVQRVKEELTINFFKKFQDEISKPENRPLRILFPETFRVLNTIGEEIYQFQTFIEQLREAFDTDLINIYTNLYILLDEENNLFQNNPWLKNILLSSFNIIDSISRGENPGRIIEGLRPDDFSVDSTVTYNAKNSIKLFQLLSFSLRDMDNTRNRYWITRSKLDKLFTDIRSESSAFSYYLGLLYQKAKSENITFRGDQNQIVNFWDTLFSVYSTMEKNETAQLMIRDFFLRLDLIEKFLNNAQMDQNQNIQIAYNDIYNYFNAFQNLFGYTADIYNYAINEFNGQNAIYEFKRDVEIDRYLSVTKSLGEIYLNINKRAFNTVIFNTVLIFDKIFVEASKSSTPIGNATNFAFVLNRLNKYGTFMAVVTEAQDTDQVKDAIEAMILPAGSARIKKNSSFNVAINAYVGLFLGHENQVDIKEKKFLNSTGICAPIGVALSWGRNSQATHKTSWTLFFPIIDIGAVTAFRFRETGDESDTLPEFKLTNILAPGAYLVYGFSNLPISIGAGAQYGPQLRKVNMDNTTSTISNVITRSAFRLGAFIAVDIPLITIYNKPR